MCAVILLSLSLLPQPSTTSEASRAAAAAGMRRSGGSWSPTTRGDAPVAWRRMRALAASARSNTVSRPGAARTVTVPSWAGASRPASSTPRVDSGEPSTATRMVSATSVPIGHHRAIRTGIGACCTAAFAPAPAPRTSSWWPSQRWCSERCPRPVSSEAEQSSTVPPGDASSAAWRRAAWSLPLLSTAQRTELNVQPSSADGSARIG